VNTEITDAAGFEGWIFYDADCRFCVRLAHWVQPWIADRRFCLLPLQGAWCRRRLELPDQELLKEMRLLRPNGELFGGADALLEIARHFWWAWPVRQLARIPAIKKLLHVGYNWVVSHRGCADGICEIKAVGAPTVKTHPRRLTDALPLLTLPLVALGLRNQVAPWIFMWAMAFALYAGCKWLTCREVTRRGMKPGLPRAIAYLLAWPGMDAADFLNRDAMPVRPLNAEWAFAAGKTMAGVMLLWVAARAVLPSHPLLAGWIGMIGITLVLHFGTFHLLSLVWQQAGVKTTPVMDKPLLAQSLAEFWSRRWNTAFNELAFRFTFRPLKRRTSPTIAVLLVFALSGLVHELVISLPARGGYGLPTGYFLIQGLGMLAERTQIGKRIGLGHGLRGWLFTLMVTAGPVFWLFPPPFITNVILPMLAAIGAT